MRAFGVRLLSMAVCVAAVFAVFVAGASATITHEPEPFSPLTGSGSGVTLHELSGVAIDEATGNVFVTDAEGNRVGKVAILGAEGGAPLELTSPFTITGFSFGENNFYPLAFDNSETSLSRGALYTSDNASESITKYFRMADGRYEQEGTPITLSGSRSLNGAGMDKEGDLWVGAGGASFESIYRVTPAGIITKYEFDPSHTNEKQFVEPLEIAVDNAGDVFFGNINSGVYKCVPGVAGEINRERCSVFVSTSGVTGVAIDRAHGDLYLARDAGGEGGQVVEYGIATGKKISEFGKGPRTKQIAVDEASGRIYVAEPGAEFTKGLAYESHGYVNVYGPAVVAPTVAATAATNVTGTKATLNGTVNPEGLKVEECVFEWGATTSYGHRSSCEGGWSSEAVEPRPVSLQVSGLESNGATYHYRVVAKNEDGVSTSADNTVTTAATVITEPASGVGTTAATLNGVLRPEGVGVTDCELEYKLATEASFKSAPCSPDAAELEPDFTAHPVIAKLTGLQSNGSYVFRLKVTDAEEATRYGATLGFTTTGPPRLGEIRATDASHDSATLVARVDPDGFGTSYHFEWGADTSYGHSVPVDFEPFVGSGEQSVLVTAKLAGLSAASLYHYRIVATNSVGRAVSADQAFETLGPCDLPEGRCLEMVSPKALGPVGAPGRFLGSAELHFQASTQPGAVAYSIEDGLPEATRSGETLYLSARSEVGGWQTSQVSPAVQAQDEKIGSVAANPSDFLELSDDLSCGVVESNQPLTESPVARLVVESGDSNLYRRNPDRSYSLITDLPIENPEVITVEKSYHMVGMSADCSRIVFESKFHYPGVGGAGSSRLYEWSEEEGLRAIGVVPNGSGGEVPVAAVGGGADDWVNTVSRDGSRVFFTAPRVAGKTGEVGKTGVFVREAGETRDLSLSQTAVPDSGAEYAGATLDGSHVYFTANAGLTGTTSPAGTDLYEYDLEAKALRDLSATSEAGGAQVIGLVGFAEEGSHVYFTARAQLVPGYGPSTEENEKSKTFSIYDATTSGLKFAGVFSVQEMLVGGDATATTADQALWTSRVTPDGRYLLFQSSANVTGYESGGVKEAYLYDADATGGAITCVSCPPDGKPPYTTATVAGKRGVSPLENGNSNNPLYAPSSLVEREGDATRPEAFFVSLEALAEGAVEGELNLYEWAHGQVFWIATEPGTGQLRGGEGHSPGNKAIRFVGASRDGTDLYFFDAKALNWENPEGRYAAWDARIGGGFVEPPAPPKGCEAAVEGSCQRPVMQLPASPLVGTLSFTGPVNTVTTFPPVVKTQAKKQAAKKTRSKKKAHRKKKGKKASVKGGRARARHANGNRRAGK